MTRRLQLLDPESRSSGREVSAVFARVRDGLLRDNKVVPAVLGVLALLIFAWLVAGALISGPGNEEQQASSQASLAQGGDSDSGETETPAPGVENRDSDASYGGFDEGPKDPFRQLIPQAGDEDGGGQGDRGGDGGNDEDDRDGGGSNGGRSNNGRDGDTGRRGNGGDSNEDFIEQRSPGGPGSRSVPGGGQSSADRGGAGQADGGQGGADQAGGSEGLFNSGGDLPSP
ncbi:MAG: hypothetical protein M3N45_07680 [Actinomycetota bacterium]|nr:hypothetical protein [Actinomycetota bacterium]